MRGETEALCWVNMWIFVACRCSSEHLLLGTCLFISTWIFPGRMEPRSTGGKVGKWGCRWENRDARQVDLHGTSDWMLVAAPGDSVCIEEQKFLDPFQSKTYLSLAKAKAMYGFQHHPQSLTASLVSGGWDGRRLEDPCPVCSPSSPASILLIHGCCQ